MMKNIFAIVAAIALSAAASVVYAEESANRPVIYDTASALIQQEGFPVKITFDDNYIPMKDTTIVENENTLVPIRDLAEAVGFTVEWNGQDSSVVLRKSEKEIVMTINETSARVNQEVKQMPVPPRIISERTYVPLRFSCEALDLYVLWDAPVKTAKLYSYMPSINDGFIEGKGISYRILKNEYPESVKNYIDANKMKATQSAINWGSSTYIILTMGEQATGGYSIEVSDIEFSNGIVNISAKYNRPAPDAFVTTALTYPVLVLELDDIYEGHYDIKINIAD